MLPKLAERDTFLYMQPAFIDLQDVTTSITTEDKQKLEDLQKLKRKLKENNILHIKADKGNSVVLIEKQEYINRPNNFINANKFTHIEKDPTNKFKKQIKQLKLLQNYSMTTTAWK